MTDRTVDANAPRIIPELDDVNREFWTGGADGRLRIQRCDACARYVHPPQPSCLDCGGGLHYEAVSGNGTVYTFTVNHQPYHPDVQVPYVVALVELAEQADVRLVTNIVNTDVDTVTIGMPVRVAFEQHGDAYVPVFEPV
jgi:uncharacterized OB-fold protein